jgi:hypothetical protein
MGNRRLLATVFVGVVLAAALLASVSIYADAIRDLGLSHALARGNRPRPRHPDPEFEPDLRAANLR